MYGKIWRPRFCRERTSQARSVYAPKNSVVIFSHTKSITYNNRRINTSPRVTSLCGVSQRSIGKKSRFPSLPYHMKEVTTMNYSKILSFHISLWVAPPWGMIVIYCNWCKNIKDQSYRYESYKGQVRKYDFLSGKWRSKGRNFSKVLIGVFSAYLQTMPVHFFEENNIRPKYLASTYLAEIRNKRKVLHILTVSGGGAFICSPQRHESHVSN